MGTLWGYNGVGWCWSGKHPGCSFTVSTFQPSYRENRGPLAPGQPHIPPPQLRPLLNLAPLSLTLGTRLCRAVDPKGGLQGGRE